jgi:hypothetical protein
MRSRLCFWATSKSYRFSGLVIEPLEADPPLIIGANSDDLVQATFMRAMAHLGLHAGAFLDSTKTEEEAAKAPEETDRRIENANILVV